MKMSSEPQLFRVNLESQQSERIEEVNCARLGLQERKDIQEWIATNPSILCLFINVDSGYECVVPKTPAKMRKSAKLMIPSLFISIRVS